MHKLRLLMEIIRSGGAFMSVPCQKIDPAQWPRSESFAFFSSLDQPFYSVCFRVDVTALHAYTKANGLSFYHSMVWLVTQAVNETENLVRDYDNRLRMNGLDLKTYFQYTGMDLDKLRAQMRPDAERQVKTRLALEKIAALENLQVSEEEIADEYKRLAELYGMEEGKVKEVVDAEAVAEDLKVKKAIELVREKAVVTEVEHDEHTHDAE